MSEAIAVVWEEGGLFYLPEGDGKAPITVFSDGRVHDRILAEYREKRNENPNPWRSIDEDAARFGKTKEDRLREIRRYAEQHGYASKCPNRKRLGLPPHDAV